MFNKEIKQRLNKIEEQLFKKEDTFFLTFYSNKKEVNVIESIKEDIESIKEEILGIKEQIKPEPLFVMGDEVEFKLLGKKLIGEIQSSKSSDGKWYINYLDANNEGTGDYVKEENIKKI